MGGRLVNIRIKDYTNQVYSNHDGMVIYKQIVKQFQEGNKVVISFDGIDAINTSFLNSAFIELLNDYNFDFIKRNISFSNSTNQINNMIKSRFASEAQKERQYN